MKASTVALLVIGQELLNGKVADVNTVYAARRLHEIGAKLGTVVIVPDDVDIIAQAVKDLAKKHDYLITSGGIGPTHDDVTVAGIAKALGQEVIRHSYLKTFVGRMHKTTDLSAAQLRLAEVPEKAELLVGGEDDKPQAFVENIYFLPGIPEFFKESFEKIAHIFQGEPAKSAKIKVKALETVFTATLNRAVKLCPDVEFGSYPQVVPGDSGTFAVDITMEAQSQESVEKAKQFLLQNLPEVVEIMES